MPKSKTISFITTGDIIDIATSKRALGLANHLENLGWEVSLLMEETSENKKRVALECSEKIKIYYFTQTSALSEIVEKNRIIKQIRPDFIYLCAFVYRNIIFSKCIKIVEHSELQSKMNENDSFIRKIKPLILEYWSVKYSDGILYASKYLQQAFKKKLVVMCRKKIPELYFPYAYSPELLPVLSSTSSITTSKFIFVYLGSLVENYGLFTMIKAFELLHNSNINIKLYLLGEGPDEKRASEYIKTNNLNGTIILPGYIAEENIRDYFSLADAFIAPMNDTIQDWARCPSKVYMYLPYKKPIITCQIGEPFEVLGKNGYYYESGDVESLADTCLKLINNKNTHSPVNPDLHTWKTRAHELNKWIENNFL